MNSFWDFLFKPAAAKEPPAVSPPTPPVPPAPEPQTDKPTHMGATGLALIKSFEGCRLEAYQDSVGIWTIGYGHTGPEVKPGLEISLDRAEELLRLNLVEAEGAVCRFVTAPLNQNQFDALCCFTYNVGTGKFKSSTLCLLTNMREYFKAADEFLKWDKAGGVPLLGLARRRKAERELFLRPLDVNANKS